MEVFREDREDLELVSLSASLNLLLLVFGFSQSNYWLSLANVFCV